MPIFELVSPIGLRAGFAQATVTRHKLPRFVEQSKKDALRLIEQDGADFTFGQVEHGHAPLIGHIGCEGVCVIEQGAVGGIPLLDFAFGCASNAEAFVASPHQFIYFQGGGFNCSLLSFLEIGADGSVNVSRLSATPHRTAGAGGFVDITARARKIVFSGTFNAGAKMRLENNRLVIEREGKIAKFVPKVDQVSFSGKRAIEQGQDITYVTERCVIKLLKDGLTITEIAPGLDLQRDILDQAATALQVAKDVKQMDQRLFAPEPIGLSL